MMETLRSARSFLRDETLAVYREGVIARAPLGERRVYAAMDRDALIDNLGFHLLIAISAVFGTAGDSRALRLTENGFLVDEVRDALLASLSSVVAPETLGSFEPLFVADLLAYARSDLRQGDARPHDEADGRDVFHMLFGVRAAKLAPRKDTVVPFRSRERVPAGS